MLTSGSVKHGQALMRLDEALQAMRAALSSNLETEVVPSGGTVARVLARDLVSDVDLPPFDASAVDGFAVRAQDLPQGVAAALRLTGSATAGHPFEGVLKAGQSVRILTGAPLPEGSDMVVMQEYCRANASVVAIDANRTNKPNWRRRGEDVAAGAVLLEKGRRLTTTDVTLASALGRATLAVFKQLKVALFSTGDEVREPGEELREGQIWDANRSLLSAMLSRLGCDVHDFGILCDTPAALERALTAAARDHDLIVTSGGMSVGYEDHMRTIICRRGAIDAWPLALKPGKPVGLGDIDHCPILALPGNPAAVLVTFTAFGRHVIDRLSGAAFREPLRLELAADFSFQKPAGLRQYLQAEVKQTPSGSIVLPIHKQGPAMISPLVRMHGLIELPEEIERVSPGDLVRFLPSSSLFD